MTHTPTKPQTVTNKTPPRWTTAATLNRNNPPTAHSGTLAHRQDHATTAPNSTANSRKATAIGMRSGIVHRKTTDGLTQTSNRADSRPGNNANQEGGNRETHSTREDKQKYKEKEIEKVESKKQTK